MEAERQAIINFYKRVGIYNPTIEFGVFGKWKNKVVKVMYSKNNVNTFVDYFSKLDLNDIVKNYAIESFPQEV